MSKKLFWMVNKGLFNASSKGDTLARLISDMESHANVMFEDGISSATISPSDLSEYAYRLFLLWDNKNIE